MIRFQADADLNGFILRAVRRMEPGIDFNTAAAAGLEGVPDPDVLAIAAEDGRILVTHDQKTMPHHFADFIEGKESPGVIVIPQHMPIASAAEGLVLIWAASEPSEWAKRIFWLRL